jgi:cytochrome b involved in lipid metabolism
MNRTKYIIGGIIIILLLGVSFWGYSIFNTYTPKEYVVDTPTGSSTINTTTGEVTGGVKTFSSAEVATHKDTTSCYTSINGSVYDLTAWVNLHPGGKDKIIMICGIDGTERFMKKHMGGQKFLDILARYKVGTLSL